MGKVALQPTVCGGKGRVGWKVKWGMCAKPGDGRRWVWGRVYRVIELKPHEYVAVILYRASTLCRRNAIVKEVEGSDTGIHAMAIGQGVVWGRAKPGAKRGG